MISAQEQSGRRARSAARPVKSRPEPRRVPELAHLGLAELRAYRQELVTEETRVSYWRRILQARLDLIISDDDSATLRRLQSVLVEHQATSRRLAVQTVHTPDDTPPLPDLGLLWDIDGRGAGGDVVTRLADAEHQLSTYRRSLHQRLDTATGELIARYRENPALALTALPVEPADAAGVA
ncbi:MAG: RsiG family protein [Nocardioidaceae bacterium]